MNKKSLKQKFDDFFKVSASGSSFKVEIIAGIATFLAMAYILIVNPNQILYAGTADALWPSVFIATAFGAIVGTLLMSLYAKMPFAQASGMGLNSTLGAVIGGGVGAYSTYVYHYTLANALLLVFLSGIIFLLLSIVPIYKDKTTGNYVTLREKIFDGMPECVRKAIPVGIGLFIAFIGMQNAHIIVGNQYTLVDFADLTKIFSGSLYNENGVLLDYAYAIVAIVSFLSICILSHFKVKGAVIYGILVGTVVAIPLKVADLSILAGNSNSGITWKFWESFKTYFSGNGLFFSLFKDGFKMPDGSFFTSLMLVITFCMIDMFDTMGTVVGCAANANLLDENGKPVNYNKIMVSDSVATVTGAVFGTSTVTTFVESGTGIAAGGRTGLSSLVTAIFFVVSMFLLPVFAFIPSAAAAGALIYVGVLMMGNVKHIDFSSIKNAAPAFLTIAMMVLTYSITKGIGLGIISYVLIHLVVYLVNVIKYAVNKEKNEKPKFALSIVSLVIFVLFLVYFLVPTVL